jgi:hypothetical protein
MGQAASTVGTACHPASRTYEHVQPLRPPPELAPELRDGDGEGVVLALGVTPTDPLTPVGPPVTVAWAHTRVQATSAPSADGTAGAHAWVGCDRRPPPSDGPYRCGGGGRCRCSRGAGGHRGAGGARGRYPHHRGARGGGGRCSGGAGAGAWHLHHPTCQSQLSPQHASACHGRVTCPTHRLVRDVHVKHRVRRGGTTLVHLHCNQVVPYHQHALHEGSHGGVKGASHSGNGMQCAGKRGRGGAGPSPRVWAFGCTQRPGPRWCPCTG